MTEEKDDRTLLEKIPPTDPALFKEMMGRRLSNAHYAALGRIVANWAYFEASIAVIKNHDPRRERCWVAEREGEIVGAIFCVAKSKTVAQLRLLYVEPSARGLGIGGRLVEECIRFAQHAGYDKMMLWTNSVLHSARKIYEAHRFELVEEEKHHSFGHDLVAQTWERSLK